MVTTAGHSRLVFRYDEFSKLERSMYFLAHPNVRLFITHGGLLSTTETVYHGVPIIAIPILGDQKMNAYHAERGGYGIVLPFKELTEEKLSGLLDEILTNPK